MKVSELQLGPPRVLIYGDVGDGKTALSLTLGARAQVLDFDNGLRTGVTLNDKFKADRMAVDVKQFLETDPAKQATVYTKAKNYIYDLSSAIRKGDWPYDAIIIDTLSAFAWSAVHNVMANSGRLGKNPEIQHWGLAFTDIKNVLAVLCSLPCVVVLTAHQQVESVGQGDERIDKYQLAIPGKNMPTEIMRLFDEVWYLKSKPSGGGNRAYIIQTRTDALKIARSRGNLPDNTDSSVGMWELLKKCGYEPPERKPK